MKRIPVFLFLVLQFTSCATNRFFHTYAASGSGLKGPVRVSISGIGVKQEALLVALHEGCPGIELVDRKAVYRVRILDQSSGYLGLSFTEIINGRLLYARSWILTDRSPAALGKIFAEFARGLARVFRGPSSPGGGS